MVRDHSGFIYVYQGQRVGIDACGKTDADAEWGSGTKGGTGGGVRQKTGSEDEGKENWSYHWKSHRMEKVLLRNNWWEQATLKTFTGRSCETCWNF